MRFLVVGCGSIGRRHAINAAALGETAVVDANAALAADVAAEAGVRSFGSDLRGALAQKPIGVIVAVPHESHLAVAQQAVEAGAHVLVEKPIGLNPSKVEAFLNFAESKGRQVYVVCNMRFHPAIQLLRANLHKIGQPLFARAHYGNYLPDMRRGVDYRKLYAAREDSGGVVLDGVHELDYLSWLLGPVESLIADRANLSDLDIAAEDYSATVLRHCSGVRSEVHLDYVRRAKRRGCEIAGTDGLLDWISEGRQPEHCRVRLYTSDGGWHMLDDNADIDGAQSLIRVMNAFSASLNGEATDLHTGREANAILRIALAIRRGIVRSDF